MQKPKDVVLKQRKEKMLISEDEEVKCLKTRLCEILTISVECLPQR